MPTLMELAQMYMAQQNQMNDPNANIQPQGRYFGLRYAPHNMDQMARPSFGLPLDKNTYDADAMMNTLANPSRRREDI